MPNIPQWLDVRPTERAALLLGFAFHFCVLASYYLVRPLRDALGLEGGADKLQWLFTATFVVMLLMVPVFGALASRLPATRFVPLIYRLIAVSMLLFGLLLGRKLYGLSPTRCSPGFWLNTLITLLILLGQSVQDSVAGKDVYSAFAVRMGLFIAVTVYAWVMVLVLDRPRKTVHP